MVQPSQACVHSTVVRSMHAIAAVVARKLTNGKAR
jgi:hypothetical protein